MSIKIRKPVLPATPAQSEATNTDRARFIQEGDRRPDNGKPQSRTYRLSQAQIDIIEAESLRTGLGNTDVVKAALYGLSQQDENTRNTWLLASKKM